mgnify:CR=1 FL=1
MSNLADTITKIIMSSPNECYASGFLDAKFDGISKKELLELVENSDLLTEVICTELTNSMGRIFEHISQLNDKKPTIKKKPNMKLLHSFIDSSDEMFKICQELLKATVKISCLLKRNALKKQEPVKITSQPVVAVMPVTITSQPVVAATIAPSQRKLADVVKSAPVARAEIRYEKTTFSVDINSGKSAMQEQPETKQTPSKVFFQKPPFTKPGKINDNDLYIENFYSGSDRISAGKPVLSAAYIEKLFAGVNIDEYKKQELNFINSQRQLGGCFIEVVPAEYSPVAGKILDYDKDLYKFTYLGKTYYSIDNPEYLANGNRNPGFLIEFEDKFVFHRVLKINYGVFVSEIAHKMGITLSAVPNYILKRVIELDNQHFGYVNQLIEQIVDAFGADEFEVKKFKQFANRFIKYTNL